MLEESREKFQGLRELITLYTTLHDELVHVGNFTLYIKVHNLAPNQKSTKQTIVAS
jgi:hypothetical protein